MRTSAPWFLIYCLITLGGWWAGRQIGTPQKPALELPAAQSPVATEHSAALPLVRRAEDEALTSSTFSSAVEEFSESRSELVYFTDFFRMAERLPLAEFPAAMERLGSMKGNWQARLLELWATRNPAAARAWFEVQPQGKRIKLFPGWADTWARMDPAGMCAWLANRAEDERGELSKNDDRDWVNTLAEADPSAAFQLTQLYPKMIDAPTVLQIWAARDPLMAATTMLGLPAAQRSTAANFIMRKWGAQDPEAALTWIEQLSDAALMENARSGLVLAASRKDPAAALELIRSRFPQDQQEKQWRYVAAFGSMKDPERVAVLAQQQSDPKTRRALAAEAIRYMTAGEAGVQGGLWPPAETEAKTDAKRAADLWLAESSIGQEALPHVEHVAAALASQYGLDAAIGFLDRIPSQLGINTKDIPDWVAKVRGWSEVAGAALNMQPGERRTAWLEKALGGLINQGERTMVQTLIEQLPSGSEKNRALRTFAGATFGEDPQGSAKLLLTLPDGHTHLQSELGRWLKSDAFEARRWIAKTDVLNEEQKSQILGSTDTSSSKR